MNNTFNARRFGMLMRKTLLERPVQMFGFTGLLLLVVLILYTAAKTVSGFAAAQNLTFIWGLPVGSFFLASFVFGYFSSNASGASFLTLPASHFEKWLTGVLVAGVMYPLIFMIFYRIIDSSFVTIYHHGLDPHSPFYRQDYESVYLFDFNGMLAWKVYPMLLFLTGAMFLGSFYFNKSAFIKTGIAICVLVVGIFGLNWLIASTVFGKINDASPFGRVVIPAGKEEGTLDLPSKVSDFFMYTIWYFFPAALWLLSFTRLREKEF